MLIDSSTSLSSMCCVSACRQECRVCSPPGTHLHGKSVLDTRLGNLFPTQRLHELLDADCMPEDQLLLVFASFCVVLCHCVILCSFFYSWFLFSLCVSLLSFSCSDLCSTGQRRHPGRGQRQRQRAVDTLPNGVHHEHLVHGVRCGFPALFAVGPCGPWRSARKEVQSQRLNKELTKHRHFEASLNMVELFWRKSHRITEAGHGSTSSLARPGRATIIVSNLLSRTLALFSHSHLLPRWPKFLKTAYSLIPAAHARQT